LKILFSAVAFKPSYGFGGAPRVAYDIACELAKRQHEVVVYTSDAKDAHSRLNVKECEILDGIEVHYFKNLTLSTVRAAKLFITPDILIECKKNLNQFDIIHLHEYRNFHNIIIHHYANIYNVPYVLQAHGEVLPQRKKQKLKQIYDEYFGYRLLTDAAKVIALTQLEEEQYRQMKVQPDKITTIPNGIETVSSYPKRGTFRESFGINPDKTIILFIGRLHYQKGIDILVNAYSQLVKKLKNSILVIAGPDDGYLEQTRNLINRAELSNQVIITGPIINPLKLAAFADADLCVIPSRYEGFPMIVLEALAQGKPVIASDIIQHKNILAPIDGYLFRTENSQDLSNCLYKVLTNPQESVQVGLKGQKFVRDNFSIEKIVDSFERLYTEVVSQRK
jgi:glycosyltransferase involved in cell wall biosynthesis